MSTEKQAQLLDVLDQFPECFSEEAEHAIPLLPTFVPKRMNAYKVPEKLKHEVETQIQDMLNKESSSHPAVPWRALLFAF